LSNFARVIHHIDMKDVKRKRLEEIAAKKLKEERDKKEKELIKEISRKYKSDWRREIDEGMTTSAVFSTTIAPAEGDGTVTPVDTIDAANYSPVKMPTHIGQEGGVGDDGVFDSAFVGTVIRDSGTGNGSDGGFNVGGQYLAFQGTGAPNNNARFACLNPIDSTRIDTLTITAIVGNGTNGGEEPDLVAENLSLLYKTPAMERAQILQVTPQTTYAGGENRIIITPLSHDGGLNNYSITIPEYARAKDTVFVLYQNFNSGSEYDNYGVTDVKFQRKTPLNVVVPLDDPQAVSFIRVGTDEGDPKKRKKKLNDQLAAADEYTQAQLGDEFPGAGTRVGGDDPFASAKIGDDVEPSPIGKDEVTKSFTDFQQGQKKVEVLKTPEQIKAQNDEYLADLDNLITQNDYDYSNPKIIEIADKILKTDPKNEEAYYHKAGYYNENGEPEKALRVLDQLIKNNPNNSIGHLVRSYYREESGDLAGAIEDLEKGIELDPDASYVSYYEMELADLKFQEAEVETNNAKRDRMESEAGAIEAKAHEDYWNNADLLDQEQDPTIEEARQEFGDVSVDDAWSKGINQYYRNRDNFKPHELSIYRGKVVDLVSNNWATQLEALKNASMTTRSGYENIDFNAYTMNKEDYVQYVLSQNDPGSNFYTRGYAEKKWNSVHKKGFGDDDYKDLTSTGVISEYESLVRWFVGRIKRDGGVIGENEIPIGETGNNGGLDYIYLRKLAYLADNLPEGYFDSGVVEQEPINTLYDQMKSLYDEKDPEKEIKTELKAQGYEKQYKDLMSAWDSADKFSKFLTPLKNLSDALLGSKTAQNAQYENYKIAIAKSIMLNKPIRVNPDTIDPVLIKKLGDSIKPNMILSYDEEQRFKKTQETYAKLVKEGKGDPSLLYDYDQPLATDGIPLIPIVSEPVPYADENIYEDEFGRVFTNDGSVDNTTLQPDRAYHSFATAYAAEVMRKNPIAGRGQAQYQIVVPPDGTEPYLLYKDHAYHNMKSADEGEVPGFMNKGAAGFVNWLGNTAHARGDGEENTGGMAGYPPSIRGDVITQFRINLNDLPKEVAESVYRHPLMTEQPELVQVLRDTLYTDKNVKTFNLGGETGKEVHNIYTDILKQVDKAKDWIVDNTVETALRGVGIITGSDTMKDMSTASNMLQRYDEYIQQTVYTPDGRTYVPGLTGADGNVVSRINVNDQFSKGSQNHLKNILNDKDMQSLLKGYIDGGKKLSEKRKLEMNINTTLENINYKEIAGNSNPTYNLVLANSLGRGAKIDMDEFLNGKIVIKKNFEFRHDDKIDKIDLARNMSNLFDVSNDTWASTGRADTSILMSVVTMTAAKLLLRPVRAPGQSFASAMNNAPTMPYKLEFDLSEKMMNILQGIEDESDLRSGIAGLDEPLVIDKDKKNNVKESSLFERVKQKPFFNPKDIKPVFPENPPPQLDPKTGMHPEYGKTAKRYRKLDPISANAMPPTGDPETDAVVDKQKTKPKSKLFGKLKKHTRKGLTDK